MKNCRIPFQVEMNRIIELLAKQIYQSPLALLRENCQNAYDAILQRLYLGENFEPKIEISLSSAEIAVTDNGIGMTREELINHYWRAGSSGKNNSQARAAGVVGTFGIGAMANFGIASELLVTTESISGSERTSCHAFRETLSAIEDCIDMRPEQPTGYPGTRIVARISQTTPIDVRVASEYITQIVKYLKIPVLINGHCVSQEAFEWEVPIPDDALVVYDSHLQLGPDVQAIADLRIGKNGDVWLRLTDFKESGRALDGTVILRQSKHQIRTFRSRFGLATEAASSSYNFGGVIDLVELEPTAGREALTTDSLQLIQDLVTELDDFTSEQIAPTAMADLNTSFMHWAINNHRYDLCGKLSVKVEPGGKFVLLEDIKRLTQSKLMNYYEGSNAALIHQYATDEQPLIVIAPRYPKRQCQLTYLQKFCVIQKISDTPIILHRKPENTWIPAETALALRLVSILESDYFVKVKVSFGKISHELPTFVDTSTQPIEIILDDDSTTIALILRLYQEDLSYLTGMVKDFIRNTIFPRIASFVPSSTRQGAEAFLQSMRRPREVFEYEKADLGTLSAIWQDYLDGKISMAVAAHQSTNIVTTNIQIVDRSSMSSVSTILPDIIQNQRILRPTNEPTDLEVLMALPPITRLDVQSSAKLLTIGEDEAPLNGYKCFIALSDVVRLDRGSFFVQPHRTEIVWGGQKALFIFHHHSRQFGLYYELQSDDVLSEFPDGKVFPTCTIVVKNQIYIPVPNELREKFIPEDVGRKRFEVRCELLYPSSIRPETP